ncbi:MAG: SNF2-related protein, partial [Alphaproteobacteria bacterium]
MSQPPYTTEDIEQAVGKNAFWLGQEYFEDGRVVELELSDAGRTVLAKVKGTPRKPFEQTIRLETGAAGSVKVVGHCTCPVNYNCKHSAAVLIEAMGGWEELTEDLSEDDTLTLDTELWLQEIDRALAPNPTDEFSDEERQRLLYIIQPPSPGLDPIRASVSLFSVRLRNDGEYGSTTTPYNIESVVRGRPAAFLRPTDIDILRDLHWECGHSSGDMVLPITEASAQLIQRMLATGRCHYENADGPLLTLADSRLGKAKWRASELGRQRLFVKASAKEAILPAAPPFYVDPKMGACGPIDLGLPTRVAAAMMIAPEVRAQDAKSLSEAMKKRLGKAKAVPLPLAPSETASRNVAAVPRLKLFARLMELDLPYFFQTRRRDWRPVGGEYEVPLADLSFIYDSEHVEHYDQTPALEALDGDVLVRIDRDMDREKQALSLLTETGLTLLGDAVHMRTASTYRHDLVIAPTLEQIELGRWVDENRWISFLHQDVPKLKADGWQIDFADNFPLRITEAPEAWWANLEETSGMDWFDFELGIEVEGERINILPKIQEMLADIPGTMTPAKALETLKSRYKDETVYHRLEGGSVVPVPTERLFPVIRAILEVFGARREEGEGFQLHIGQSSMVKRFVEMTNDLGLDVENADRMIEIGERLAELKLETEAAPPSSFKGELRPYQASGLSWLQRLRDVEFGGVLADDMGLGKTVQTLAHLCALKAYGKSEGPFLLIAPTSLIPNWKHETARFVPHFKLLILHGPDRKHKFAQIQDYDLVLTTYPLLARDQDIYLNQSFDTVILDEAQAIKNPKATVTQVAHKLSARHRLALTGTPLENNLSELWSIFRFIIPGLLLDSATFRRRFRTPIEKHGDKERQRLLSHRIRPFLMRRTKDEVAKDLPPKSEIIEYVALEGSQRDLYETIRLSSHQRVREAIETNGLGRSKITILDALMKLRQVCCDPRLVKLEAAADVKESAKTERLMEMLPQMLAEGRRILLFSQFTSMLDLIQQELEEREIPYALLTGQTKDREIPV